MKYRLSEQNLIIVMNHLPAYGVAVIAVSSEQVGTEKVYTLELDGPIPESEIYHFNTGGQFLEVL